MRTIEQLKRLYEEAREASKKRLQEEKKRRQRERERLSIDRYSKLKELRDEEQKRKQQDREDIKKLREGARLLLRIYKKWVRQLLRSLQFETRPFVIEWRRNTIQSLQQDIENLEIYLDAELYKAKLNFLP